MKPRRTRHAGARWPILDRRRYFGIIEIPLAAAITAAATDVGISATLAATLGGIGAVGLEGAAVGAGLGAATGGNPLTGAIEGGLTAGLTDGLGGTIGSALGIGAEAADVGIGAAVGAAGSAATGGNVATGALGGAASGAVAGLTTGTTGVNAATSGGAATIAPSVGATAADLGGGAGLTSGTDLTSTAAALGGAPTVQGTAASLGGVGSGGGSFGAPTSGIDTSALSGSSFGGGAASTPTLGSPNITSGFGSTNLTGGDISGASSTGVGTLGASPQAAASALGGSPSLSDTASALGGSSGTSFTGFTNDVPATATPDGPAVPTGFTSPQATAAALGGTSANPGSTVSAGAGFGDTQLSADATGYGTGNATGPGSTPQPGFWDQIKNALGGAGSTVSNAVGSSHVLPALVSGAGLLYNVTKSSSIPGSTQIGTAANQLAAEGSQLQSYLNNGTLPPGAQAGVNNAVASAKAAIRSQYASKGMSGSSAEIQSLNQIDQNAAAQSFTIAEQLLTQGVTTTDMSAQLYDTLLKANTAQSQQTTSAIASLAAALGGGGTTQKAGSTNVSVTTGS